MNENTKRFIRFLIIIFTMILAVVVGSILDLNGYAAFCNGFFIGAIGTRFAIKVTE